MTRRELKEQLDALLEGLPEDKATLLVDFAIFLSQQTNQMVGNAANSNNFWDDWEREVIAATLEATHYQISRSAAALGISRKTLLEKRKKYGLK